MDADRFSESAQFARKLQQAVLSLRPGAPVAHRQVPRMAQALAMAELMAAKAREVPIAPLARASSALPNPSAVKVSIGG
jgi:hypothetical protein